MAPFNEYLIEYVVDANLRRGTLNDDVRARGVVWIPFFIVEHSWVFCIARAVISDVPVLLLRQPTVALHPPWGLFFESPENFSDPKSHS